MDRELRRQRRLSMRGVPERLGLQFAQGSIEMRAKPNGTAAGSNFEWNGYATVYGAEFDMWDPWNEPYKEDVAPGAAKRSLSNPNLDVPFLVGHNDAGIPLARTKSGTMKLSDDTHGVFTHVPSMDGRREEVRALASAVERGDMDEMSLAFICNRQEWDDAFEHRTVAEMDLHRGDVSAVIHGANPATAGAMMFPVEQLSFRRPASIGAPVLLEFRAAMSLAEQHGHPGKPCIDPDGDGDCDQSSAGDTDHDYWTADGRQIKPLPDQRSAWWQPYELRADKYDTDDRKRMASSGQAMSDGSYPIADEEDLGNAIHAVGRGGADHDAIRKHVIARAKALGKSSAIPDNWNADGSLGGQHAAAMPLELRASAADDINLALSPDYNAGSSAHPAMTGVHTHPVTHQHQDDNTHAASARVVVDDTTGIPGEETQFSAARKLELMMREIDMEELSIRR